MKIKTLKIEGFRSIKDTLQINVPNICALIGPNNCGKSNIISAINKVLNKDWITVNSFDESDVYCQQQDRDIIIEIEFEEAFNYHAYADAPPVPIPKVKFHYTRYKIGPQKGERRLSKSCLSDANKEITVLAKRPKKGEAHKYEVLNTIPQIMQESIPIIFIGTDRTLKNQLPNARNSILATLLRDINDDFLNEKNTIEGKKPDGTIVQIPRKERFKKCIDEAIKALKTDEFLSLEKSIKTNALHQLGFSEDDTEKLDIFFHPLTSYEFYKSLGVWVKECDYTINAAELGSGFQNAIVISIVKAFEERKKSGAIFLIEEPEMFLHPQMQRSLYKTLRKIGETNQVIYITHSPHFVTIPEFDEIVMVRKDGNGTSVIQSELEISSRLKSKFQKELDPERNELFFASKVLFVEGDTEKLAFPEYAKRQNIDFDKVGVSIIEVGGKRNLVDFIELSLSLRIPTGFVYDTDSSDFSNPKEEEEFNNLLESFKHKGVKVWSFKGNYEKELINSWSLTEYEKYCSRFHEKSKVLKAKLLASDFSIPIPAFVNPIITWLGSS